MSTQEDIYAAGSESRPPMLNKENYVPWSSRFLCDTNREVLVNETFDVHTLDELTKKELKQIEADDQAIQTILLSLLEDIYAAVDSCETTQEIWLRVQQMMKGFDIGIQEKKAKLFKEWESQNGVDMLLSSIKQRTCIQLTTLNCTQTDKAPVYDLDGSAEYTKLLEPIPEPHQVPQNDNNIISEDSNVEQSGETVEQHLANVEETRSLYDSLYQNLAIEVEKVNT
nr:hypothetical protein [Tanacetum cinerariifolium]